MAHSMSTRAARKALEAAEKLLLDSQPEMDTAARLLRDVEEEVAAASCAEKERKGSATRTRDQLEEGLARTNDPGLAQEVPGGGRPGHPRGTQEGLSQ
eukprot:8136020-Heterocapsa_arctica.AAC.1